ncbi:hypothetical protein TNCV_3453061 [Trichonephila clavipes]|nr:hypothetical protein TNCV_3453061 [Trichonephila clavipes]
MLEIIRKQPLVLFKSRSNPNSVLMSDYFLSSARLPSGAFSQIPMHDFIDPDVMDFSNNFQKHPYSQQITKNGHQLAISSQQKIWQLVFIINI